MSVFRSRFAVLAALLTAFTTLLVAGSDAAAEGKGDKPVVIIKTNLGDVTVQLDPEKAPKTVENFLAYVDAGFYDGTVFHRVIKNFMIQGGGMTADGKQKPTRPPIKNEANNGLENDVGTIAMARTNVVDSATAQFFINTKDNDFLNHGGRDFGYAVFGKVTDGMDVVRKIEAVETGAGDVPRQTVTIVSIKRKTS
ncbi:Peptidyl-prolyl cis-trans isomerase A [Myxococcaceae bacterium]|jgi:peptidyl-prolyl cis-trans isomerase A (cyclophilin A)|nr:Peptidyl-prolyl cis-trans isomerase A [Myxococcaceae bacterium]